MKKIIAISIVAIVAVACAEKTPAEQLHDAVNSKIDSVTQKIDSVHQDVNDKLDKLNETKEKLERLGGN